MQVSTNEKACVGRAGRGVVSKHDSLNTFTGPDDVDRPSLGKRADRSVVIAKDECDLSMRLRGEERLHGGSDIA